MTKWKAHCYNIGSPKNNTQLCPTTQVQFFKEFSKIEAFGTSTPSSWDQDDRCLLLLPPLHHSSSFEDQGEQNFAAFFRVGFRIGCKLWVVGQLSLRWASFTVSHRSLTHGSSSFHSPKQYRYFPHDSRTIDDDDSRTSTATHRRRPPPRAQGRLCHRPSPQPLHHHLREPRYVLVKLVTVVGGSEGGHGRDKDAKKGRTASKQNGTRTCPSVPAATQDAHIPLLWANTRV